MSSLPTVEQALAALVAQVTVLGPDEALAHLADAAGSPAIGPDAVAGAVAGAVEDLVRLVRLAPLRHSERESLLESLSALAASPARGDWTTMGALVKSAELVRKSAPRFPEASVSVQLEPLDEALTAALLLLFELDAQVPAPWTLIGGLMVQLHCTEHAVTFSRPTGDADIAVGVFTHRGALRQLTQVLRDRDFTDESPPSATRDEQLSYRWRKPGVKVDVGVPPKANEQRDRPLSVTGRPAVELPATQQALRRSERLRVVLADGRHGSLRRPDLLGALVVKAQAALSDRRDTDRHREDLVALCDALASSGLHVSYREQVRAKDIKRLMAAAASVSRGQWRRAGDPAAARAALEFMTQAQIVIEPARR